MDENRFLLKDYRATHQLMNFLRGQMQGWFTRENVLLMAGHPDSNENNLLNLKETIKRINDWNDSIVPGGPCLLSAEGGILSGDLAGEIRNYLNALFSQYASMNDRLNDILDNPIPFLERREDLQYMIACLAWNFYAINHMVHGDNHFARKFNDDELLKIREGDVELSQKEIDFINFLVRMFKSDTLYSQESGADITSTVEKVMNDTMTKQIGVIDYYLTLSGC